MSDDSPELTVFFDALEAHGDGKVEFFDRWANLVDCSGSFVVEALLAAGWTRPGRQQ